MIETTRLTARAMLGIISSVESGVTTPEEAVVEVKELERRALECGAPFKNNYTLEDFQKIRKDYLSDYLLEDDDVEDNEEDE